MPSGEVTLVGSRCSSSLLVSPSLLVFRFLENKTYVSSGLEKWHPSAWM